MRQVTLQQFEALPTDFGRYRVVKLLGQGGMGAVYLAQDTQLDRPVALKIPTLNGNEGPEVLERFQREARAAATILHPNVCPLYDVGAIDGAPYLTMGYIDGKPLAAFIAARPLPPRQSVLLVRKLALALAEAHKRGVIHRDLKPGNVMIDKRSEPIVMDFGLARRSRPGDERLTKTGTMMGTPAYMPPEQISGDVNLMGPGCDIYSLGVILYELLAGRLPFVGDAMAMLSQVLLDEPPPPSRFRPELDPELDAICLKAMAKKVPDRYVSMTELAAALQDYLRGKPQATESAATATLAPRPAPGSATRTVEPSAAETLKPADAVRATEDTRPAAQPAAKSTTTKTLRKTSRPRRKTKGRHGVPLWAWIAGGVGTVAVVLLSVLLLVSFKKAPATQHAAAPTPTLPDPATAPKPPGPTPPAAEFGTIQFEPSEPAPDVQIQVDGKPGHQWGTASRLSVGEHTLEVTGQGYAPLREKFTVQAGSNQPHRVKLVKLLVSAPPPQVSPETPKLLVERNPQIYLIEPDGGEPVAVTDNPFASSEPAWSPDGKQIVFASSRDGTNAKPAQICVMDADGRNVRQLTNGTSRHSNPSWGVNGKILYSVLEQGGWVAWVMNADGTNQTKLTADGAHDNDAAWSPDGKSIAFTSIRAGDNRCHLYVMDADGKNVRGIAPADNLNMGGGLAWSPDGKRIAYTLGVGGFSEIWVIDRDGNNRKQVTRVGGINWFPGWSPDGKQIAFVHDRKTLYLINEDGSGLKKVLKGPLGRLAWKPSPFPGDKLPAFGSIRLQPSELAAGLELKVDGVAQKWGAPLELTVGEHNLELSRQGTVLVRDRFAVRPGPNATRRVTLPPVPGPFKLLASVQNFNASNYDLFLLNADGSDPVKLTTVVANRKPVILGVVRTPTTSTPDPQPDPAWSPDGKRIVFSTAVSTISRRTIPGLGTIESAEVNYHVLVENVADKKAKQLTKDTATHFAPVWSVDDRIAYYSDVNGKCSIWIMKADGTRPLKVTPSTASDTCPAWSPDGKQIAFASLRNGHKGTRLYVMDADGKNVKELTHEDNPNTLRLEPAWSPDGKRIACVEAVARGYEVFVIGRDGSNRTQLTRLGGSNRSPAWSPDGKQIAFVHEDETLYLINADGSSDPKEIFDADKKLARPAWKPGAVGKGK